MPVSPTFPGVYVDEVISDVHSITGVATSIAAFLGRALKGPVNEPISLNSPSDYERIFGGLWTESPASYAVSQFFQNGGVQAIFVRVAKQDDTDASKNTTSAKIPLSTGGVAPNDFLNLYATSPGSWGKKLSATVDYLTQDPTAPGPASPINPPTDFNLTIFVDNVQTEQHQKVSLDPADIRFLPRVLKQNSALVQINLKSAPDNWELPNTIPEDKKNVLATGGNDGDLPAASDYKGRPGDKSGIYALEKADLFNLLCIPPPTRLSDTDTDTYSAAMDYCKERRAMLIVDSPYDWGSANSTAVSNPVSVISNLKLSGDNARNAAVFFPRVLLPDSLRKNQLDVFVPCGIVAGVMSRTDVSRGVWKSPAGIDASLNGTQGLQVKLTDKEQGNLNQLGINCLRHFPVIGRVVWGARTLRGADLLADEYKYLAVRRTALFIEESLYRGTKWVVFEPNDDTLWAQIRLNVGAFMHSLFLQGAFQGTKKSDAYFVKVDSDTTTQNDINLGIVNILVGFAPLKPAEFVIIKFQQITGNIEI